MNVFKQNAYGGVDIHSSKGEFLIQLNSDDLKQIFDIQQKGQDVKTVRGEIPDWVGKQLACDDFFFADFNSHLFSNDEISEHVICHKILTDERLIQKIAEEYRDILDDPATEENCQEWYYADEAIRTHVSIKDVMGEILFEKYPKEFCVGQWRVAVVQQGEMYGHGCAIVHEDDKPVVEFYDMSVDKKNFPNGQFTSGRYYLESLLTDDFGPSLDDMVEEGTGLALCGGVDAWVVSPGELNVISSWLKAVNNHIEHNAELVVYRGEVDVPFGYGKSAKLNDDAISGKVAEDMLKSRLSVIPEFDNVNVEQFGEYDKGFGLSFSFTTSADEITVQALLKHVFNDLKYEAYREGGDNTLDNTLTDAQERSQQSNSLYTPAKDGLENGGKIL